MFSFSVPETLLRSVSGSSDTRDTAMDQRSMDANDRGQLDQLLAGVLFVLPLCHSSCSDVMSCSCVRSFAEAHSDSICVIFPRATAFSDDEDADAGSGKGSTPDGGASKPIWTLTASKSATQSWQTNLPDRQAPQVFIPYTRIYYMYGN